MLVTQSQSQISKSNLLQGKGNSVMRDITSPSSPQWMHMGLSLHPLAIKALGACKKSLKLTQKCC